MSLTPKSRLGKENARFRNSHGNDQRLAVDVPLSRREVSALRRTRGALILRWGALVAVTCLCLGWSQKLWARAFRSNPEYSVGQFQFKSNGLMSPRLAALTTGLHGDMNLMEVDINELRRKLLAMPRMKTVAVERRLPDRLIISVEERLPIAWLVSQKQGLRQGRDGILVDREGVIFRCEELLREYVILPEINVIDLPPVTIGRVVDHQPVLSALEILTKLGERTGGERVAVRSMTIPNTWTVEVQTMNGMKLTFHSENITAQLGRMDVIQSIALRRQRTIASINLQMSRNVPVTFFDQPAMELPDTPAAVIGPVSRKIPDKTLAPQAVSTAPVRVRSKNNTWNDIKTILRGN